MSTSEEAVERVLLLESLQTSFQAGIEPEKADLERAASLGLNVEALRKSYGDT